MHRAKHLIGPTSVLDDTISHIIEAGCPISRCPYGAWLAEFWSRTLGERIVSKREARSSAWSSVNRLAHDSRTHHRQETAVPSLSYVSTGWEDFQEVRSEDCIRGSGGINIPIGKRRDEPI